MRVSEELGGLITAIKDELGSYGRLAIKTNISKAYLLEMAAGKIPGAELLERVADKYPAQAAALFGAAGYTLPDRFRAGPQTPATNIPKINDQNIISIPILGVIRAGQPILASENIEGYLCVTPDEARNGEYFYLRVSGDSMNNARICDGDLVFVRCQSDVDNRDIAVVLIDDDNATLKRVIKTNGGIILQPESTNPDHVPVYYKSGKGDFRIIGKVLHVKMILGQ